MSTAQAHDASHLQHKVPPMKTATLPPLRVDPALREAVESVLQEGESPSGHALRFVHAGPFVDIDATYDLITSHLDAEGFEAQESFVEEYVTDAQDEGDPALVVFIYVFLR